MTLKQRFSFGTAIAAAVFMTVSFLPLDLRAQEEFAQSHLDAAKRLVNTTKALGAFDDILPVLSEQTKTLFIQSDPSRTQEMTDVTDKVALNLAKKRSELNKVIYEIWARRFSEQELTELADFYSTPLGIKLADQGPSITALAIGAARQWQDMISTEMVSIVREELDKKPASE